MVELSELTLVKATPEQEKDISKYAFAQWGRGMQFEQFLEVYNARAQLEQSIDGKRTPWILIPRNDTTSLNYLCFCETFRRDGVIAKPQDTHPTPVVCYGIASVLTPPENRGHGYASHMMKLLHWVLAPPDTLPPFPSEWGLPPPEGPRDGQFSVLYSDIGSTFYHNCGLTPIARSGWETISPISTSWKVDGDSDSSVDTSNWTLLTEEDAYAIWEKDSKAMEDDVAAAAKATGNVAFSFLPTGGVAKYTIQSTLSPDKFWGVARRSSSGSESPSAEAYATWTYEFGTQTIVLTRLRASAQEFPALLEKLKEAARTLGKDTIEAWNVPEHLQNVAQKTGGKRVKRDKHLSAVKWYGQEEFESGELAWVFNEKFCWC